MRPETKRGIVQIALGARFEIAYYTLMNRSNNNGDLYNEMSHFIHALNRSARFGVGGESLSQEQQEELKNLFKELGEKLEKTAGGSPRLSR